MKKLELLMDRRIYDCSSDVGEEGWWCLDGQRFANTDVEIAFLLIDDSLAAVSLYRDLSEASFADIFSAISSRLQLIQMHSKEGVFDLVLLAKSMNQEDLVREYRNFEQRALNVGNLTYTFLDANAYSRFGGEADSTPELISVMEESSRTAEIRLSEDEFGSYILVRFDVPKLYEKTFFGVQSEDF